VTSLPPLATDLFLARRFHAAWVASGRPETIGAPIRRVPGEQAWIAFGDGDAPNDSSD
jgi:hypothetical protein